ncbi:uncharacterized protein (TIGR03086 family) [Crossiella equi]|uniref:Uncharacterized protein (TIGR03086 family) n=1 Tax=Crossiella equi TaxID=130796 RepID=A0ABS5ABD2_9PSEU|nr:TIGR03086 family metal-binding protein [Crossiella equi]MBP2473903.1 uncharacterized protein (TIGR03086 family) [Crossiella equi]
MTEAVLARHAEALDLFGGLVHEVRGTRWEAPTPCADWTVRDLVNHLTAEQLWVPDLVTERRATTDLGEAHAGDVLGEEPAATWDEAAEGARAAFNAPDALDGTVTLSYGESATHDYCAEMTLDAVVHSWDLARALGADDTLPPALVSFALAWVEPQAQVLAASSYFGEPVEVAEDADDQTRLLALLGRSRDWPSGTS